MSEQVAHTTVLLDEAVEALIGDVDGCYIDGTFGRGGHSSKVLSCLSEQGQLIAIDKDPLAEQTAREIETRDARLTFIRGSFADLLSVAEQADCAGQVAGVLLDLGVSSPQLDEAARGFSFLNDGPLDMRMNPDQGQSVADWLATAEEGEIAFVLKEYGEERFARRMARAIVAARQQQPITRTVQLAEIVAAANPAWEKGKHPATRAFQAMRIFINDELKDLERLLDDVLAVLAPGGRLVVISFHSLEDRMVKRFIRDKVKGKPLPKGLPILEKDIHRPMRAIGKAIKPGQNEVAANPRSRSAVMRVAEKIAEVAA